MNENIAERLRHQLDRYDKLKSARDALNETVKKIFADDKEGPCGQGPFTGNTRESRTIMELAISFSRTRGGAPETFLELRPVEIDASEFGRMLEMLISKKVAQLNDSIAETLAAMVVTNSPAQDPQ